MGWYWKSWKGYRTTCPVKENSQQIKIGFGEDSPISSKKLEKKFGKCIQHVLSHKTPGMPKFLIVSPMTESKKISEEDQQKYQSGVGMLLYLVKCFCPNLANATRKLFKANNGVNCSVYKEPLHVIQYVLDKKIIGLKMEPTGNSKKPLDIMCFSDSNYAGVPLSRRSISGFILHILLTINVTEKCITFQLRGRMHFLIWGC